MVDGPSLSGEVLAVNVGRTGVLQLSSREERTAFRKTPATGAVMLATSGFEGDEQAYPGHGGLEMAGLVYSYDHYAFWRERHELDLPETGAFAENLTVDGLVEADVCIGDVFRVGEATVQVNQPRTPCYKIAARYGRKRLAVDVQEMGFTGYMVRVLEGGLIGAGDAMTLERREQHGVTVAEVTRVLLIDKDDIDGARRIAAVGSLTEPMRKQLASRFSQVDDVDIEDDAERLNIP